jgi:hypothetical protein
MHCLDIEVHEVLLLDCLDVAADDFAAVEFDRYDASIDEHFDDDDVKLLVVEEQMAAELLVVAMMEYSSFRMN